MIAWSIADNEADRELGAKFLCRHGTELGLLYSWSTVMSSLSYAMEDNGFLIGRDRDGRVAAVLAHTVGTLDDGYRDLSKVEIHLLYLEEGRREGATLLSGLRAFVRHLLESPRETKEVVFFTPSNEENRRRFGKVATRVKTTEPPCGTLDYYAIPMDRLLRFDAG
ncbi:hypothetical protein [Cohnella nanjingensis]|uniref:GNAT family N-acetyltransferase n=1 Tax=Cohnella nanjingensis TaxID=1387779 RepID=A0A7X0RRJ5_9BACL|nr:hypothetical protein [Cohnella nanjingensis]MBB6672230.1 hypothetical protein [Cohnella nanjingensis]